jgi:hypothetical protein
MLTSTAPSRELAKRMYLRQGPCLSSYGESVSPLRRPTSAFSTRTSRFKTCDPHCVSLKATLILVCAGIAAVVIIVGLLVLAVYTVLHERLGIVDFLIIGGIIIALCLGGRGRGDGWFTDVGE